MKKGLLTVLLLVLLCFAVFAANQKIYRTDSQEYENIKLLYIATGHALPSTTGPWSNAELLGMISKIDRSSLTGAWVDIYDSVMESLNAPPKTNPCDELGFNFNIDLNLELFYHTNTDEEFRGKTNWVYNNQKMKPFFNFSWESYCTDMIYAYFAFPLMNELHGDGYVANSNLTNEFGYTNFAWNMLFMQDSFQFKLQQIEFGNFPERAFAAFGGNHWTLQFGRDRLSWGAGESGNLVISDNLPYHSMLRFTTFFDSFKYTYLLSFFPHKINYYTATGNTYNPKGSQSNLDKGISFYQAHRVEGRFLNDKLGLTLTEAMMYMSEDGHINPMWLNPSTIYHGYYIRFNSNSTLAFEADYTPIKGLNIYGAFIVDEFAAPGEPVPGKADAAFPNAYGRILGVKAAYALGDGIIYGSGEYVHTDPYLYLRYGQTDSMAQSDVDQKQYGLDYVVAIRNYGNEYGISYDEYFLGYKYGGDLKALNFNVGYRFDSKLSVEANVFYMMHGTHDKWTGWNAVGTEAGLNSVDSTKAPTTKHESYNKEQKSS